MALSFPNLLYTSGANYDQAVACSLPIFECPFAQYGLNERLILRQDFIQNVEDFAALALDTAHPNFADFILVEEGPHIDLGGGRVRWTRTYARVPDEFTRPNGNYNYTFPGYTGTEGLQGPNLNDRDPFIRSVPVVVVRTFALGAGALEPIEMTRFYYSGYEDIDAVLLDDGPPGGLTIVATVPSRTEYSILIQADAADPDSYSLVVETRAPEIWMGNIYMRETIKTKAI